MKALRPLIWIVISRMNLEQLEPLHQCGACQNAFHVWDCAIKGFTSNTRPKALEPVLGLFSTVHSIASSFHEICYMFQCPYHVSKHKMVYSCIILDKDAQMFGDPDYSYYPGIISCTSFEQPLYFVVEPHTWNASRHTSHWCYEASFSKSVWRITI